MRTVWDLLADIATVVLIAVGGTFAVLALLYVAAIFADMIIH